MSFYPKDRYPEHECIPLEKLVEDLPAVMELARSVHGPIFVMHDGEVQFVFFSGEYYVGCLRGENPEPIRTPDEIIEVEPLDMSTGWMEDIDSLVDDLIQETLELRKKQWREENDKSDFCGSDPGLV